MASLLVEAESEVSRFNEQTGRMRLFFGVPKSCNYGSVSSHDRSKLLQERNPFIELATLATDSDCNVIIANYEAGQLVHVPDLFFGIA